MFSPDDILEQAEGSMDTLRIENKKQVCHILHGIKMIYDKKLKSISLLNTTISSHYYKEFDVDEYMLFTKRGWLYGVYEMALRNYKRKLEKIEYQIKAEVNSRKNDKKMKALKQSRVRFMNMFAKVSRKKNLLIN